MRSRTQVVLSNVHLSSPQVDTSSRKKNLTMAERVLFDAGQLSKRGYDKWRLERSVKLEPSKYAARRKRKAGRG